MKGLKSKSSSFGAEKGQFRDSFSFIYVLIWYKEEN